MKSTVKSIAKSFTNLNRYPVSWLELFCGHSAKAVLVDGLTDRERYTTAPHDNSKHKIGPGDEVECERCDWRAKKLEELRALPAGAAAYSRFRTHDSRGHGPGSHYLYKREHGSPTGVILLMSCEDHPEEVAEIRRITGTSSLSPTERA